MDVQKTQSTNLGNSYTSNQDNPANVNNTALDRLRAEPTTAEQLGNGGTLVADAAIEGSDDNSLVNTDNGILGTRINRQFGKQGYLVDDQGGYRAFANVNLSLEDNGNVLRIRGNSEAIEHNQRDGVPQAIYMQEFITVRGRDDTGWTFQISGQGSASGTGGGIGAGIGGGTNWENVSAGDIKTQAVTDRYNLEHDLSGTIVLPPNAESVEYKLNTTFVNENGDRISRSVSTQADLP